MKAPGVFDPWRQMAEPPARRTMGEVEPEYVDLATVPMQHCVQFKGLRAGINVWVVDVEEEDAVRSAREHTVLVDLVHRLCKREVFVEMFREWGILLGIPLSARSVSMSSTTGKGDKKITISVPAFEDRLGARAVDALSLALREAAQRFSDVRDVLATLKIHPYVK